MANILEQLFSMKQQKPENLLTQRSQSAINEAGGVQALKNQIFQKKIEATLNKRAQEETDKLSTDQLSQMLSQAQASQNPDTPQQSVTSNQQQGQSQGGKDILSKLLDMVISGGGVDRQGVAQPTKLLGGLLTERPGRVLQRQQAQAIPEKLALAKKELGLKEKKTEKELQLAEQTEARLQQTVEKDIANANLKLIELSEKLTPESFNPFNQKTLGDVKNTLREMQSLIQGIESTTGKVKEKLTDLVNVTKPDGQKTRIRRSDLKTALSQGYKRS